MESRYMRESLGLDYQEDLERTSIASSLRVSFALVARTLRKAEAEPGEELLSHEDSEFAEHFHPARLGREAGTELTRAVSLALRQGAAAKRHHAPAAGHLSCSALLTLWSCFRKPTTLSSGWRRSLAAAGRLIHGVTVDSSRCEFSDSMSTSWSSRRPLCEAGALTRSYPSNSIRFAR